MKWRRKCAVAYSAGQIPVYYNHPDGSACHQGASIGFGDFCCYRKEASCGQSKTETGDF